jgi:proteasome lid subunit RPN8/RPN11
MPNLENDKEKKKTSYYERSLDSPVLMKFLKNKEEKSTVSKKNLLLKWKAYKRIIGYSYRYANNDLNENKWREVYGILIGSIEDDKEVIKDAVPMVVGDRAGVKYESQQYVDMAQIDASTYERAIRDKKNDFIIGWWHTHPGFGFFLSPIDCLTQLGYQIPNPNALALVFDHTKKKGKSLGIAAINLRNPEIGVRSAYDLLELNYELDVKEMIKRSERIIKKTKKIFDKVEEHLNYCRDIIGKKALQKLHNNFGLISGFKYDFAKFNNRENLYVWENESNGDREENIPEFRKMIESQLEDYKAKLLKLRQQEEIEQFEKQKEKFRKKILKQLEEPQEFLNTILEDFKEQLKIIFPYFDFLDTNERKTLEFIDQSIHQYHDILDSLKSRALFNLNKQ